MPRRLGYREGRCMTCRHPEVARINYLLVSGGASLRPLAAKFNLSVNSLHYHRHKHISPEYVAAVRIGPLESEEQLRDLCAKNGVSVVENLRAINAGVTSRWLAALESGSDDVFIALTGQIRKNLELLAKLTKELVQPGTVVTTHTTIQLFEAPRYVEAIAALSAALRPYPEARAAAVAALRGLETGSTTAPLIEARPEPREAA
jgi:hypothetical protein